MKNRLLSLVALYVAAGVSAESAPQEIFIQDRDLEMNNGRALRAVAFKSFDPETGYVVITSERSILKLKIELFPDAVQEQIKSKVVVPEPPVSAPPPLPAPQKPQESGDLTPKTSASFGSNIIIKKEIRNEVNVVTPSAAAVKASPEVSLRDSAR